MNIQRFTASTAREALAKARLAFGDGTLILSNRPTSGGVEVVATGEETLAALDRDDQQNRQKPPREMTVKPDDQVAEDTTKLTMSTLSFQDYVRERMLRRRHEALSGQTPLASTASPAPPPQRQASTAALARTPLPQAEPGPTPIKVTPAFSQSPASLPAAASGGLANELQAMKNMIEERFNTLTWLGQARQNPIHANVMLKLIRSGFSPTLARTIVERLPPEVSAGDAMRWVVDVLTRNLRTDSASPGLHEQGGTYALIGATGVGKTTTTAKLAGLCARAHGPASVGLITLDTYRVGAHEQLRAYGRMLGVVAHLAHDRAALQDLLSLLAGKKMVLIDTTGIAPNDPRKSDMLGTLDLPGINRLLVLNAGGHGDTLDGMVSAFKSGLQQQTILSKTDEAVKIGPALDACIRHQLVLRGVTTGQKVPEDWERADASHLVGMSLKAPTRSAFDPQETDLGFFFAQSNALQAGHFHA
ncbi:flagellar biosynthesis protein FlhF [mine drainage metagenome]|uniref:Flagellar biosynthesis protein FlhF n=1 Tax=mine drainage metagenome TaxID=410659 RepID=A0A1J5PEN2_9ZZZZ